MNVKEEEIESLIIGSKVRFSEDENKTPPSRCNSPQEWLLHIIPIKPLKSLSLVPLHQVDQKNTERVIHSSEAPEQTYKFVQNYLSLNLDQVMDSKIGPSGFYLKYLMALAFFCTLMGMQIVSFVTFAFQIPTYICKTGSESANTFKCTEDQYCQKIYNPIETQYHFDSYTKEFDLHCDMPGRN